MTTFNGSSIFSVIAALLVCNFATASEFNFRLTPPKVVAGEHARLELRIPLPPASDGLEPIVNDNLLLGLKGLSLLSQENRRDGNEWILAYDFTGYQTGSFTIPPVEVRMGSASYSTESMTLAISAGRAESDTELRPEEGRIAMPVPWARILKLGLLLVAIWIAAKEIHKRLHSLKKKAVALPMPPPPPEEDPLVWLRREVAAYRKGLESGDFTEDAVDRLTYLLKEFFAKKLKTPIQTWTTQEMDQALAQDAIAAKMLPIFKICDTFKFSGNVDLTAIPIATQSLEHTERELLAC